MTTTTLITDRLATLAPGVVAHIWTPGGDAYVGEVTSVFGDLVTLVNFTAWYEDDSRPYESPYCDDAVRVRVARETVVEMHDARPAWAEVA